MVEEQVFHFVKQQNRPYNTQMVADHLAQYGLKKGPIQKALDSLSDAGKIKCKEFGKTKIYMALQAGTVQLSKEEMDEKAARISELTEKVKVGGENVKELKKVLKDAQNMLTAEELDSTISELQKKADAQGSKLATLKSGATLIPPKDRAAVEKNASSQVKRARELFVAQNFAYAMTQWAKRKRIFKDVWSSVSENVDQKQADLFEEIGIETDESVDLDHKSFEKLLPKKGRV